MGTSSSKSRTVANLLSAGILEYFDVIITEDDIVLHKPDPEVYVTASARLGVLPSQCIVVEDAPNGVAAAKNAGMVCIALSTPYVKTDQLRLADIIIDSLENITVEDLKNLTNKK